MKREEIKVGETYVVEISPLMKPFESIVVFRGKNLMFGINDEGKESAIHLSYFVKKA